MNVRSLLILAFLVALLPAADDWVSSSNAAAVMVLPASESALTLQPDTVNWLGRVAANGGTISVATAVIEDIRIQAIRSRGLWTADLRYNPQLGDALALVVPVYVGAGLPALDVLHGSPTIDVDGFDAGNVATKYVDTGINPFALGAGWDTRNASLGLWMSDGNDVVSLVANKAMAGAYFSGGTQRFAMYWKTLGNVTCEFGDPAHNITRNARTTGILSGYRLMFANAGTTDYWEDGVSAGGTNGGSTAVSPNADILIGQVNGGGIVGSGKFGGYHIGCLTPLTEQNAADWSDVMSQAAQALGRMHNVLWHGDSLVSSTGWANLYQTTYHPRTGIAFDAVGGTTSAQCLARMITLFADRPCLRWWNQGFLDGQNDSKIGGWDGSNTIANMTAMLALIPHTSFRVSNMIYGNRVDEYFGQPKRATKDSVSAAWLATYGTKCLNFRDLLLSNGLGTGQDAIDVTTHGVTPSSLHKRLAAHTISAITNAANAAVTLSGALADDEAQAGDCFDVAAVGGMTQLNSNTFQVVTLPDLTHLTLNVDSTGFGTYTSGGTATLVDFIHFNSKADPVIAGMVNASTASGWSTAINENPLIANVTPAIGSTGGGTAVTVLGSGFTAATGVTFDGIAALSVVVVDDNHITCITPADGAGGVSCAVITPYITNTMAGAFTYQATSPPVITSATAVTGNVGSVFTYQITASNGPTAFIAYGLPRGLALSATTGAITGMPSTVAKTYPTIIASNAGGTGTATLTLTVLPTLPVITSATAATGHVGSAFSYQITARNNPTSFGASGLPAGLTLDPATGAISGFPTVVATTYPTITATNAGGTCTATLTLTVAPQSSNG